MEKNLEKLLTLVKEVCNDHRQYKKGFNVITTFVKPHREVELHSRFITWLLDPKGPHKLKHLPLELFLKKIGSHFTVTSTTKVIPNASNWTEDRDMDILIYDKEQNFAIIIENKIYAKDSDKGENNGQLARYLLQVETGGRVKGQNLIEIDKYYSCKNKKVELYYLTLDMHEPNEKKFQPLPDEKGQFQKGERKVEIHEGKDYEGFWRISYLNHIEPWLEELLEKEECRQNPQTTEIICQYLDALHFVSPNIKLNQDLFAKIEESLSYMQTLRTFLVNHQNLVNLQPEKIEEALSNEVDEPLRASAIFLLKNHKHLFWHAIASFMDNLGNELQQLKIEVEGQSSHLAITDLLYHPNKHTPIYFRIKQNGIVWTLQADDRCREKGFFLGIDKETEPNKDNASEIQNLLSKIGNVTPIEGWHIVKYLHECTIEFEGKEMTLPLLNLWDFTQGDTFDLLNEDKCNTIAKQYADFVKQELNNLNSK